MLLISSEVIYILCNFFIPLLFSISMYLYTMLIGKLNANVAPVSPLRTLLLAHILSPCFSIMLLEIKRPKPVPPVSDFVTNFVKSFGNIWMYSNSCILYFNNNIVVIIISCNGNPNASLRCEFQGIT